MDAAKLKALQALSLEYKVDRSIERIVEWYHYWKGNVAVSFSGGKDSTVLLHLVRAYYPEVPAVFVDTGLEYPEIRKFVKTFENVVWLKPEMNFKKVIERHGYPVSTKKNASYLHEVAHARPGSGSYRQRVEGFTREGKKTKYCLPKKWKFLVDAPFKVSDHCCKVMKINPLKRYQGETDSHPYIGTMASNSQARRANYLRYGCNTFDARTKTSRPLGFWLDEDIWEYLKLLDVPYCEIYDMGEERTGCMFCMFGVHLEKGENRFQRMKHTHPAQYRYCMEELGLKEVLEYIGVAYE